MKEEQGLGAEDNALIDRLFGENAFGIVDLNGPARLRVLLAGARAEGAQSALSSLKQAERALEPFAREADEWGATWSDAHRPEQDEARATFTVGDLRRARQALSFIRQTESMG